MYIPIKKINAKEVQEFQKHTEFVQTTGTNLF